MEQNGLMEKIVSLCKRRGFVFPGSEIYGGLANSWDYGPLGVELKNNIKNLWWDMFVRRRDDIVGIDAALIMNPKVWEASGHLANFTDPLVECKKCHHRFRADKLDNAETCPDCGGQLSEARQFNLMFKTFIGSAEDQANIAYFRPETAQAMFVDFKNVLDTTRKTLPFGIAQVGKAFRNEITPGNFIFRTREFEQMEIEYFIRSEDWEKYFEHWRKEMVDWMKVVGIDTKKVHELDIPDGERAHYSKKTIDFEFDFPFGRDELYGLAYRTDFDLKNHFKEAPYRDPETNEEFWPHVIEPTWGVDRTLLALLLSAYTEAGNGDDKRVYLKLPPKLAPYKAAVFPLLRNKPDLVAKAEGIYKDLKKKFMVTWDDRGNIGKRYYSQDEIGTPFCITVDFQTLEDGTVTVRDRDSGNQERKPIGELEQFLHHEIHR
ncbi:MAG: glycine--tRNA ligase [Candidatus Liptonbacteria bacterium RIFCSPHIGHO2_01_FULL_57_28]|uniref:Glycine--tRNA ligase n=1 Tax=Candidatus Liptonbacteria bacterium RIFCSPHIGHO2_01_FULL_57_28 TaxID=1798647 RepID=A0A1G2CA85_9BACT|nr:MAG: glycine--tRNA ligase [Candidatus Liptonbacteria bacterium RIFCSPHIGHO2_01_FULL_57_28]